MKTLNIVLDYTEAEELSKLLEDKFLSELALYFAKGYENLISTYAIPLAIMSQGVMTMFTFENTLKAAIETKTELKLETPEAQKAFAKYQKESQKKSSKVSAKKLKELSKKTPFIENAVNILALNSMVNAWTNFETLSKDIWIHLLNSYPHKFVQGAINHSANNEIEGIKNKNISISLLRKYNFTIENHLGEILEKKFDFTSVRGIKKSFTTILDTNKYDMSFLDDPLLSQLEITRHLVVHKAGITDREYLKRSIYKNEKNNSILNLSAKRTSRQMNSAIHGGIKLLKISQQIIKDCG